MVSFTAAALFSLAAIGTLAAPRMEKRWHDRSDCMCEADAQRVANNYGTLIASYSDELANAALAKDFTDYSEGVNTLINTCPQGAAAQPLPLLSATFSSRKQFEVGQGEQPAINFNILDLEYNCNSVTIRWETTNTAPIPNPRPVVGLIVLKTEKSKPGHSEPWIVHTVYSEFDSGAWLQNLEQAGICSVAEAGSPTIQLPSGTAPAPTATVYASASAPAVSSAPAAPSSYVAPVSSAAAPSSYATPSVSTPASYAPSATASAYASTYSA